MGQRLELEEVRVKRDEASYEAICRAKSGKIVTVPYTMTHGPSVDDRGACPPDSGSNYWLIGVTVAGMEITFECQRDGGGSGSRIIYRTYSITASPKVTTSP
jgi:hypothetical protein